MAALRETEGIILIIASEEFPAKPGESRNLRAFCFRNPEKRTRTVLTMNATMLKPEWRPLPPARKLKLRSRQRGFALYGAQVPPGMPARIANAHARFEQDARHALREWLML